MDYGHVFETAGRDRILDLVGAVLADPHDEWAIGRRYLSETSMAELIAPRDTYAVTPGFDA